MSSGANLYKRLIKELAQHHKYATKAQSEVVRKTELARTTLAKRSGGASEDAPAAPAYTAAAFDAEPVKQQFRLHEIGETDANEIVEFLKHQRQYKELLDRYTVGPADTLDRVKMTARRVGLNADDL